MSDSPRPSRRHLPRALHACQLCRIKKARCDQQEPCSNCRARSSTCVYPPRRNSRPVATRTGGERQPDTVIAERASRDSSSLNSTRIEPLNVSDRGDLAWDGGHGRTPESMIRVSQDLTSQISQEREVDANEDGLPLNSDPDTVGDINKHTSGTEFYGTSSNFVLLNQLFSYAQLRNLKVRTGAPSIPENPQFFPTNARDVTATGTQSQPPAHSLGPGNPNSVSNSPSHLSAGPLSVVNLLYNEEAMLPPSRPKTPVVPLQTQQLSTPRITSASLSTSPGHQQNILRTSASIPQNHLIATASNLQPQKSLISVNLEKEYIRLFFNNLHHLHPMLLVDNFTARCEDEIWSRNPISEPGKDARHFFALYNIVIAVGSLVAGTEKMLVSDHQTESTSQQSEDKQLTHSPQTLSRRYFRKSKALLGDVFEACSLESAQTLFLMSLYCQNSLMPHSCYMYSGMAVRTALAIGMPSESISKSIAARKAARRTWWCIYSHEIDMCCSSGRRDSLRKPESYLIPLPLIMDQGPRSIECEEREVAMINEMVKFAAILRRVSKEIYHDSKGLSLLQKSARALELDNSLGSWRADLPEWLNLDAVSFREPEWASKQKLVLQLRYLNARILLHRPFLASVALQNREQLEANIELCLEAARKTIYLLYESYTHKPYFRTWWYNSTYTLYAGMIILYVVLLNYTKIPGEELLWEVEKSHKILRAMEEASVAQRSADLMLEVTEVTKRFIAQRQRPVIEDFHQPPPTHESQDASVSLGEMALDQDDDWSRALFPQEFSGLSRGDMLVSLIDPNTLQGFTTESGSYIPGDPFSYAGERLLSGMRGQRYDGEFLDGPIQNYY